MMFILIWIAFGVLSAFIAAEKGRSALAWLILGVLFGVFALVGIIAVPSKK